MRLRAGLVLAMALWLGGCVNDPPKPKPPLAARLEQDGAGDLTEGPEGAPMYVIDNFFTKKGLAYSAEIRAACDEIRRNPPIGWDRTVDMRICFVVNMVKHGAKP
jgi:hypothetical protein